MPDFEGAPLYRIFLEADRLDIRKRIPLAGADLYDANLNKADLKYADLSGANLKLATLTESNLWHADLTNANLHFADLTCQWRGNEGPPGRREVVSVS